MRVLKFGGSSVASATNISKVMDIVVDATREDRVILVSSAISGCTDTLIKIGEYAGSGREYQAMISELENRHQAIVRRLFTGAERIEAAADCTSSFAELSALASSIASAGSLSAAAREEIQTFGERFSTRILARKFACEGYRTLWLDSRALVRTAAGKLDTGTTYSNISSAVKDSDAEVFVAPGFIASDENGRPVTLGRGGSDYSAAIYAAAVSASTLQIWTDVPGIMTTNPKVVPSARTISSISYKAALDLANGGAKVLYAPTIAPARDAGIAINIRNTFDPSHPGTIISDRGRGNVPQWQGVANLDFPDRGESVITLVGECITPSDALLRRVEASLSDAGIKATSPAAFAEDGVVTFNVRTIIMKEAVAAVHREFFEDSSAVAVNVFVAGFGAVGHSMMAIIAENADRIAKRTGRSIRIAGLSDSRRYVIDLQGIEPGQAEARLASGSSEGTFVDAVCASAPRRSVFVDCTNSHDIWRRYGKIFEAGLNIVTSNRRSLALSYAEYVSLKESARENGCFFRYDTTVGTALPVLESIAGGANCSDAIVSIEAVVSCTLNYIISEYDGLNGESFANLLLKAQNEGLTEHDPRTDLGGRDALRKLLILSREAGVALEESDVDITPMLGPDYFDCPLDEFYSKLLKAEPEFIEREKELDNMDRRQRFVASIVRDPSSRLGYKAEIRMREVDSDSPFFRIRGTENVIIIKSENSAPLVIKGSGEGARQAAAGVINNILKV